MKKYFNIICIVMIILISIATPTYSKALTLTDIYNKGDSFKWCRWKRSTWQREWRKCDKYIILDFVRIAVAVAVIIGTVLNSIYNFWRIWTSENKRKVDSICNRLCSIFWGIWNMESGHDYIKFSILKLVIIISYRNIYI